MNRLGGREVWIAVIEIPVGEGQIHRLIDGVDVAGAVIAHAFEVEVLKDVQGLEHGGPLCPVCELVNFDSFVGGLDRLLNPHLPVGQVFRSEEAALFSHTAH